MAMKKTALLALAATLLGTPAFAQIDLSGHWVARQHEDWEERGPGPEIVDFLGLPVNDEARARGLAYSTSSLSLPERQCLYYTPAYIGIGPFGFEMWSDTDPVSGRVIAWKTSAYIDKSILTVWMDGRPHPGPNALHTFAGFTTGEWEGNTLTTYTTHFKEGYLRRNGVPTSDQATLTMHISRHGDTLTIVEVIEDPVYLTEPFVVSRSWQSDPTANLPRVPAPCVPETEVADIKGVGDVPHYLPGKNPFINDVTRMYHIPVEAVMGGAETMYPEYRKRLKDAYVAPVICTRYCCGWGAGMGMPAVGISCLTGGSPEDVSK
jgi:hypothetical protein